MSKLKNRIEVLRPPKNTGGNMFSVVVRFHYLGGVSSRHNLSIPANTRDEMKEELKNCWREFSPKKHAKDLEDDLKDLTEIDIDDEE